mmetsp:Transcript_17563/g.59692  ORF Transcript_17563/g.59692 Transcript_17563/m.59692 type:complete len:254 (-) Transcript_17563:17-778(-)
MGLNEEGLALQRRVRDSASRRGGSASGEGAGCLRAGLVHRDARHLDGRVGVVARRGHLRNGPDNVEAVDNLPKHGVLGRRRAVEEVEEAVVRHVDEDLAAAAVGLPRVGHGERPRLVGDLVLGRELVRDAALAVTADGAVGARVLRVGRGPSRARAAGPGVAAVGAAELSHEVGDDAVEVQAVVEALVRKGDEVGRRDGHAVHVKLGREVAHGRVEGHGRVAGGSHGSPELLRGLGRLAGDRGRFGSLGAHGP